MEVRVNGIKLFYQMEGTGPTLLFLHALGLDHTIWRHQFDAFRGSYTVVAPDLRGHGRSDKPPGPYTIDELAADVASLLSRERLWPATVVGLSLGGMVAMALAADHPELVRALVVVAAIGEVGNEAKVTFEQRAVQAEAEGMAAIAEAALQRWFTPAFIDNSPKVVSSIKALVGSNEPRAYAAACRAVASLNLTPRLGKISCPTLIVAGEKDPAMPPAVVKQLHYLIRGSRFEIVANASHLIPVEQTEAFNNLLSAFLAEINPRPEAS